MKNYQVLVECITNGSRGCWTYQAESIEAAALKAIEELKNTAYRVLEVRIEDEGRELS